MYTRCSLHIDICYSGRFVNVIKEINRIFGCYSGEKIEHILHYWHSNYELLEDNHNYIQWYIFCDFVCHVMLNNPFKGEKI